MTDRVAADRSGVLLAVVAAVAAHAQGLARPRAPPGRPAAAAAARPQVRGDVVAAGDARAVRRHDLRRRLARPRRRARPRPPRRRLAPPRHRRRPVEREGLPDLYLPVRRRRAAPASATPSPARSSARTAWCCSTGASAAALLTSGFRADDHAAHRRLVDAVDAHLPVRPRPGGLVTAPAVLVLEDGRTFRGAGVRRRRRDLRRGRLQHRHDRLPGDAHRPELPPPGRRHDGPAHRQHRRQRRGPRVRRASGSAATSCATRAGCRAAGAAAARSTTSSPAQGVVGIAGVDTRALTRHLRERGAMKVGIFSGDAADRRRRAAVERVAASPPMEGADLAHEVTTAQPYVVPGVGREALRRRGARPRHQDQHAALHGAARLRGARPAGHGDRRRPARAVARRRVPVQRPGRPGDHRRAGRGDEAGARGRRAAVRHLLRQPDPRPGARPRDLQAALRPPRGEPAGAGRRHRPGARHQPQPRLRRRRPDGPRRSTRRTAGPRSATSTSTTTSSRGCACSTRAPSRCSTTRRPPPGRTTRRACSTPSPA